MEITFQIFQSLKMHPKLLEIAYSIVKDSSADLGVNYKIVQIRPTVKAVLNYTILETIQQIFSNFQTYIGWLFGK